MIFLLILECQQSTDQLGLWEWDISHGRPLVSSYSVLETGATNSRGVELPVPSDTEWTFAPRRTSNFFQIYQRTAKKELLMMNVLLKLTTVNVLPLQGRVRLFFFLIRFSEQTTCKSLSVSIGAACTVQIKAHWLTKARISPNKEVFVTSDLQVLHCKHPNSKLVDLHVWTACEQEAAAFSNMSVDGDNCHIPVFASLWLSLCRCSIIVICVFFCVCRKAIGKKSLHWMCRRLRKNLSCQKHCQGDCAAVNCLERVSVWSSCQHVRLAFARM